MSYGRSRSFKVTETGNNPKPVCDFLLDLYMPIFYRYRDVMIYWSKTCVVSLF